MPFATLRPISSTPSPSDARTEITTKMLADGYKVTVAASFVQCFLDQAKRDPITGEIGKAICFAVSRRHATKLLTILEEATRCWPATPAT